MKSFNEYNTKVKREADEFQAMAEAITSLALVLENENFIYGINESINESVINNIAGKFGIKIHKGKGIIDYIKGFATGAGKMMLAAIKGDKKKVAEIAKTIKKEEVVDFLLKLDMATLHLVTGPIHFIDAVTGWDLAANISHGATHAKSVVVDTFQKAVEYIKDRVKSALPSQQQKPILKHVARIEQIGSTL